MSEPKGSKARYKTTNWGLSTPGVETQTLGAFGR